MVDASPAPGPAPKRRFLPSPATPSPNPRILLRIFLAALALALTIGYIGFILPDYMDACALPLNLGCCIILFLAWKIPLRFPTTLSRTTIVILIAIRPLLIAGQWNVLRVEAGLGKEIDAGFFMRLGCDRRTYNEEEYEAQKKAEQSPFGFSSMGHVDEKDYPVLLKRIEDRAPGWPRALGKLYLYTDLPLQDRGRERYDRPYTFCATFM